MTDSYLSGKSDDYGRISFKCQMKEKSRETFVSFGRYAREPRKILSCFSLAERCIRRYIYTRLEMRLKEMREKKIWPLLFELVFLFFVSIIFLLLRLVTKSTQLFATLFPKFLPPHFFRAIWGAILVFTAIFFPTTHSLFLDASLHLYKSACPLHRSDRP